MAGFMIDVNLPYRFSLWSGEAFVHMRDLGGRWSDSAIWRHAQANDLVIVTKDTDFSDRALISQPPPRVVHVRVGNLRIRELHALLHRTWPAIVELSRDNRLVQVFADRIEAIQ
jgi:predicted nuclease of predicted toxin-antitoxin system